MAYLLSIDLAKAFDRLDHLFIRKSLAAWGLGSEFIQLATLSLHDSHVVAESEGTLTEPVLVTAGVKQGCPLSPLLFILALEGLLMAFEADPDIKAFTFNGERTLVSSYADDTSLYLNDLVSIPPALSLASRFKTASGLGINVKKSWILPLLYNDPTRTTLTTCSDIRVLDETATTKLLGDVVGPQPSTCAAQLWNSRCRAYQGSMFAWDTSALSYLNRALTHTIFAQSTLVYATTHSAPAKQYETTLLKAGRRFLWQGKPPKVKLNNTIGKSEGGIGWRCPLYAAAAIRARWIPLAVRNPTAVWTEGFNEAISLIIAKLLRCPTAKLTITGTLGNFLDLLPYITPAYLRLCPKDAHAFSKQCLEDWIHARGEANTPTLLDAPITFLCQRHSTVPRSLRDFLVVHGGHSAKVAPCIIHVDAPQTTPQNGIHTTPGRWATATGHSLQHGPTKSSEFIAAADISAKALYWSFCENKFETPTSLVQWKNAASSWHITGQQVPSNTFWRTLLDKTLPKDVFNTNYELGHYLIPLRPAGQKRTLCRHCHLCLETPEHIVVHCTKIGKLLWPAIWRALARLGCTPTTHDEGTLILSLGLLPGSAAATVLAFARSTIIFFHTNRGKGAAQSWPQVGLSYLEASLKHFVWQRFLWAGRCTSNSSADTRRRVTFDKTWTNLAGHGGLLQSDWTNHRIRWSWHFI
jgi:hypothetical protein